MFSEIRRSLYVFLSSLLGVLLFIILHRLLVFGYVLLLDSSYSVFSFGMSFLELLALEYLTLIVAVILGGWYGTWLGLYWYGAVYEKKHYGGFVEFVSSSILPVNYESRRLQRRIAEVSEKMEDNFEKIHDFTATIKPTPVKSAPVKRRVVRTRGLATGRI